MGNGESICGRIYKNGTVYTGNGFVTDFAVENGKFCFGGRDG